MGGRGTFAAGNPVEYEYEIDTRFEESGRFEGVKILKAKAGYNHHDLPECSHSSDKYLLLDKHGNFKRLRVYNENHIAKYDIDYHGEVSLTGNRHEKILHYHEFEKEFSLLTYGDHRKDAEFISEEKYNENKKYLRGLDLSKIKK